MNDANPLTTPLDPQDLSITSTSINVNGQNYDNINQLPPELQQTLTDAFSKLNNGGGGLNNIFSALGTLAQNARENGISVASMKTTDLNNIKSALKTSLNSGNLSGNSLQQLGALFQQNLGSNLNHNPENHQNNSSFNNSSSTIISSTNPTSTTPAFDQTQPRPSLQPFSANHNPHVKTDSWRKVIWLLVGAMILGYLYYKFGGQIG